MTRAGVMTILTIVAVAFCCVDHAKAQNAQPVLDDEIAGLFSAFCLQGFPDPTAIDELAKAKQATIMTVAEVTRYLKTDPGRGWYLRTPAALYAVTVESPPFNACAVRRMTPSGLATTKNYIAAVNAYVTEKRGKLVTMPAKKGRTPEGIDISGYGYGMMDAAGKPSDTFSVILTNYRGKPPAEWRADAGSGVGIEVRMVRQIVPQ